MNFVVFLVFCVLSAAHACPSTALANEVDVVSKDRIFPRKAQPQRGSPLFTVHGNVYPDGYYYAAVTIANKPYFLDLDTGSDLTWVQCDAPSRKFTQAPPHPLFKPTANSSVLSCSNSLCASIADHIPCQRPKDPCHYEVGYADDGSSFGVLLRDAFTLTLTNGSKLATSLAFGCGYDRDARSSTHPRTDGVLGLGVGGLSIVSQLSEQGVAGNVAGHCLDGRGGGFLFLGNSMVPSSGISWVPYSDEQQHYSVESVELVLGSKTKVVEGMSVMFDSGSTYTYFSSQNYESLLAMINSGLKDKPLKETNEDGTLPVCWKGKSPFKNVGDVASFFLPLTMRFGNSERVGFAIPPPAYLIVSKHGNACLGILNGTEVGLDKLNVIGDISMQDKLVIYDNEGRRIGWASSDCSRLPKL